MGRRETVENGGEKCRHEFKQRELKKGEKKKKKEKEKLS